ncbi:ParB N-terminal domain-containing protein [Dactylosporangium sp. NPDC048998]|uniref:ParB/RepB/Spo0J family partition protein n=1 Tax=Dactylosporangium sp. NPDC048998 TaxID=3363976 RepID=UPI00371D8F11
MPQHRKERDQHEEEQQELDPLDPVERLGLTLGPVVDVEVGCLWDGLLPRSGGECPDHVRRLADAEPGKLPPIIAHRPTHRVVDGMHRLRAAVLRGDRTVPVRFLDGDPDDAFVLAVWLNAAHGLPLSAADRRAAAERILGSHPAWSDRMIASVTGLSARTVGELRRARPGTAPQPAGRIGRDGRVRPVDRLAKRRLAAELMSRDPELSLRQVARVVGISPETVRSVRAELRAQRRAVGSARQAREPEVRERQQPAQDSAAIVRRLRADPMLRFSETGRVLLRLLDMHTLTTAHWAAILRSVPPHNRATVASLAMECARVWRLVGEHLNKTDETPDREAA